LHFGRNAHVKADKNKKQIFEQKWTYLDEITKISAKFAKVSSCCN